MSRIANTPLFVRGWLLALCSCAASPLVVADQTQEQAEPSDSAPVGEPPLDLAGSWLGGTTFATIEPEYAETLLFLVRDLADDGVLTLNWMT